MSYRDHDPHWQRQDAQSLNTPIQHNGFVNPQQLLKPAANVYTQAPANVPYQHANGFQYQSNPANQYAGTNYRYPPQTQHQAAAVVIPPPSSPANIYPVNAAYTNTYGAPQQSVSTPQNIPPKAPSPLAGPRPPEEPKTSYEESTDQRQLLMSLAEDYIGEAHRYGPVSDLLSRERELEEYYKLITTGLGCLEAVLKHFRLSPEFEARTRLRYATILYEETENVMEAEESLSKGIAICERHRFDDLKYNTQHVLTRVMFRKNARAAFKYLEGCLADADAYQHIAWVYALRFLKVSLHMELSSRQDTNSALSQLRLIASSAQGNGDKIVLAVAATMEALIALRDFEGSDGFEQAQRALAGVRSLQLEAAVNGNPQVTALTLLTDNCCHLQRFNPAEALSSMANLQKALDNKDENAGWDSHGSFAMPLSSNSGSSIGNESGFVRRQKDGSLALVLQWMPKDDIYNIAFLLFGLNLAHKNTQDGGKAEKFLTEGIKREADAEKDASKVHKSITQSVKEQIWREEMTYYKRLHLAFVLAARNAWDAAGLQVVHLKMLEQSWPNISKDLALLTTYLEGSIAQGTGDLSTAVTLFDMIMKSTNFADPTAAGIATANSTRRPISGLERDLSIISAINKLLIIRSPAHPLHASEYSSLLAVVTSICTISTSQSSSSSSSTTTTSNEAIKAAYNILISVPPASSPILTNKSLPLSQQQHQHQVEQPRQPTILALKSSLQSALNAGKALRNQNLICMVLTIMSHRFFTGIMAQQTESAANVCHTLAKRANSALWTTVTAANLAKVLENKGREDEARKVVMEGEKAVERLPGKLRETLGFEAEQVR